MSACARCGRVIAGTAADPIIAASSLGAGYYHDACAREAWAEEQRRTDERARASRARRADHARRVLHASRGTP